MRMQIGLDTYIMVVITFAIRYAAATHRSARVSYLSHVKRKPFGNLPFVYIWKFHIPKLKPTHISCLLCYELRRSFLRWISMPYRSYGIIFHSKDCYIFDNPICHLSQKMILQKIRLIPISSTESITYRKAEK